MQALQRFVHLRLMENVCSPRIISLLPSATEIVYALGFGKNLVGRSHECDYPAEAGNIPVCTATKLEAGLSSKEIDTQVNALLRHALSIYTIDVELIKSLQPDIIITQDQCRVCAVSLTDLELALADMLEKPTHILSLQPQTLPDVFADIQRVAACLNAQKEAEVLLESLNERIEIIGHKLKYITERPTLACIEWLEPLMLAGNWVPQLITAAGGTAIPAEAGKHSGYIKPETLLALDPDILVLTPCGFSIAQSLAEVNKLMDIPGFADLKAIKNNRLYIADGNQYFNRPTARLIDSVDILAEIIYPKQFIFGFQGQGWIRFEV